MTLRRRSILELFTCFRGGILARYVIDSVCADERSQYGIGTGLPLGYPLRRIVDFKCIRKRR